jgi:hypothetical protein
MMTELHFIDMLRIQSGKMCTLCPPVKYVTTRIAKKLGLTCCLDEDNQQKSFFNHAIPVVSYKNQILFAPTSASIAVSEETLTLAIKLATKYSQVEKEL